MSARVMRKFNEAANIATKSTMFNQHGAVVVAGGKTIAVGCNSLQPTHNRDFGLWQHAEVAALTSFRYRVQGNKNKLRGLCRSYSDGREWKYKNFEF